MTRPSEQVLDSTAAGSTESRDVRVHMVSLGCPKNLVDSEVILGGLGAYGLAVTPDAEAADIIVINTCGFVESAKEESIQSILEACELKSRSATPKKVVVTGCLGQRYGQELQREIPELDAIVGLGEYKDLGATLIRLADAEDGIRHFQVSDPTKACFAEVGRFRLTPTHFAYIRISEGCDNPCTFCSIPSFRGRFRSKPIPMILEEARELVASGARELLLISQDTTSYGVDIDGTFQLPRLLESLAAIEGVDWIRVLYAYPAYTNDEMLDTIARLPNVLDYVDIPLQHISDAMLRRMGRRMNETKTRALISRMREKIPGVYLRTTFIVGFPGETDRHFEELCDYVRETRFERLGVFTYSPEENTPSATFADQIPDEVKTARLDELMRIQQTIAFEQNEARKGEIVDVIIDRVEEKRKGKPVFIGRSRGEAPEIDPVIHVGASEPNRGRRARSSDSPPGLIDIPLGLGRTMDTTREALGSGAIVRARIIGSRNYDLLAALEP
jgi:ribosomal protein S12 methylthiotransferase